MRFWLDPFTVPIEKDGALFPARETISLGEGLEGEDDPDNDTTILSAAKRNSHKVTLIGGSYAVLATDDIILITAVSGSSMTITLPAAPVDGHTITIKDANYLISGSHTIVIQPGAKDLENDNSTITLATSGFAITLAFGGAVGWVVLSYGDSTTLPQPD